MCTYIDVFVATDLYSIYTCRFLSKQEIFNLLTCLYQYKRDIKDAFHLSVYKQNMISLNVATYVRTYVCKICMLNYSTYVHKSYTNLSKL